MPDTPSFLYYLSNDALPIAEQSDTWNTLLPLSRKPVDGYDEKESGRIITYRDYFRSVRSFLEEGRSDILKRAASQYLNRMIAPGEIKQVRICLEKHGAFYHPARLVLEIDKQELSFVVNVAVSSAGTGLINREYEILEMLRQHFPHAFIPKVYGRGEVSISHGNRVLRMFLGEWFEGFNEFHISRDQTDGRLKLMLWNPVQGSFFLSSDQAKELYSQAAMILTYYYNIETFEQISHWHHAAGDFVVKLEGNNMKLKLVTVRQYASILEKDDPEGKTSAAEVLEAMLIFFLNLTLRMRLDRLDGVGDLMWSDSIAASATMKGFYRGLALKVEDRLIPARLVPALQNYLSGCTETDLLELLEALVNQYNPKAPEIPLIKTNLKEHAAVLYHAIYHI